MLAVEGVAEAPEVEEVTAIEERPEKAAEFEAGSGVRGFPDDLNDPIEGDLGGVRACEAAVDLLLREERRCCQECVEQRDDPLGGNGTDFRAPGPGAIAWNRDESGALEVDDAAVARRKLPIRGKRLEVRAGRREQGGPACPP